MITIKTCNYDIYDYIELRLISPVSFPFIYISLCYELSVAFYYFSVVLWVLLFWSCLCIEEIICHVSTLFFSVCHSFAYGAFNYVVFILYLLEFINFSGITLSKVFLILRWFKILSVFFFFVSIFSIETFDSSWIHCGVRSEVD